MGKRTIKIKINAQILINLNRYLIWKVKTKSNEEVIEEKGKTIIRFDWATFCIVIIDLELEKNWWES